MGRRARAGDARAYSGDGAAAIIRWRDGASIGLAVGHIVEIARGLRGRNRAGCVHAARQAKRGHGGKDRQSKRVHHPHWSNPLWRDSSSLAPVMVNKWYVTGKAGGKARPAGTPYQFSESIPGIADQRLSASEQQHQQDSYHPHHGEHRLIQQKADHTIPEPGRVALDPGAEGLLAGLMDVVPELAEPGEAQALVGDPAGAVIDHEDKSAGQQQEPHQAEKTADHRSPSRCHALKRRQPLPGRPGKFNLISTLPAPLPAARRFRKGRKALTLQNARSIRPAMAAGAILPPLFFERRRQVSHFAPVAAFPENT